MTKRNLRKRLSTVAARNFMKSLLGARAVLSIETIRQQATAASLDRSPAGRKTP